LKAQIQKNSKNPSIIANMISLQYFLLSAPLIYLPFRVGEMREVGGWTSLPQIVRSPQISAAKSS
jgi:hypothetical protein